MLCFIVVPQTHQQKENRSSRDKFRAVQARRAIPRLLLKTLFPRCGSAWAVHGLEGPEVAVTTHFLAVFMVDLVTLPLVTAFLSTALMIPMATVCLMSGTAKRPRTQVLGA